MPMVASVLWLSVIFVWSFRGWVLKKNGHRPSVWFAVFIAIGCAGFVASLARLVFEASTAFGIGMYANIGLAVILLISSLFAHKL